MFSTNLHRLAHTRSFMQDDEKHRLFFLLPFTLRFSLKAEISLNKIFHDNKEKENKILKSAHVSLYETIFKLWNTH